MDERYTLPTRGMMAVLRRLRIADDLALPVDAATQTFAFIARKGAGKTYAAGKLAELLLEADVQVVVLDTVGNWFGLRLSADGKGKGFDVPVFGGLRKDLPLEAAAGDLVADIVVDTARSFIIDVSQFSLGDRKRFATKFGERLWQRKKGEEHPSPVMLIIEESQLIVPQMAKGDDARMLGIYEEIIRLGRNYGIGCTMITQRPQSVNKEVLNQTECLFVGQINGSQERDALKKWITHQGMDVHLVDELPSLSVGSMYVWSPQWLQVLKKVRIEPKKTFDASATPKVGQKQVRRNPAPLDVHDLESRMAAVVERAKAEDPRELRKQIAELQKQMKSKSVPAVAARDDKAIERELAKERALFNAEIERLGKAVGARDAKIAKQASAIRDALEMLLQLVGLKLELPDVKVAPAPPERPWGQERVAAKTVSAPRPTNDNGTLPKGERIVLTAIAQCPEGITRDQLGVLTGYKKTSRDTYLKKLAAQRFTEQRGDTVRATEEGIAALGDFEPLPMGDDLRKYWLAKLPQGERIVLETVIATYPSPIAREQIDESTGYKKTSRDTYVKKLAARRLVETSRDGVRASDQLFE